MAIETGFFLDSGLSQAAVSRTFTQKEDGSSNPVDALLYFGCPNAAKKAQAESNPGTDPITLSLVTAINPWAASTAYNVGDIVQPTVANGYKYKCVAAGTSGVSEPTWPTTLGSQLIDNGVTWLCLDTIHVASEFKLSTSQAGLDTAVAGAPLEVGATLNGGTPISIHLRGDQGIHPFGTYSDVKLQSNSILETAL